VVELCINDCSLHKAAGGVGQVGVMTGLMVKGLLSTHFGHSIGRLIVTPAVRRPLKIE